MADCIVALASALPSAVAVIRCAGADAFAIAAAAGAPLPTAGLGWQTTTGTWPLGPLRVLAARGPGTFTGTDTVELLVPGAPDLATQALDRLRHAGATDAAPGAFTRLALANRRLTLDRAEALLALVHAHDAPAAARALERLRGSLGAACAEVRERLIDLRARVEAGLDFAEEPDVRSYEPRTLQAELKSLQVRLRGFLAAGEDLGQEPVVLLVGPANAGKSALFAALTGAPALVSPVAGTTRDHLEAPWDCGGRLVRLVDTAGWFATRDGVDQAAVAAGRGLISGASLIFACSAPDAPLPDAADLPMERTVIVATKGDLGPGDPRASHTVHRSDPTSLNQLAKLARQRLEGTAPGNSRQQGLLRECLALLAPLTDRLPADELLADDLTRTAALLGDLLGATTTDEVLAAVFQRFCIGK